MSSTAAVKPSAGMNGYVAYARLCLTLILFKDDKLLQLFRLASEK